MGRDAKQKATSWRYQWFEEQFLNYITRLDWAEVAQEAAPLEEAETRTKLAAQQATLEEIQRQLARLADALATKEQEAPRTILAKMTALEKDETKAKAQLITTVKEAAALEAHRIAMRDSGDEIKELVTRGDFSSRMRLREEIRRKIQRIDVFAEGVPPELLEKEDMPIAAPGWPSFRITFANAAIRWVFNPTKRPAPDAALVDAKLPPEEVPAVGDDDNVLDAAGVLRAVRTGKAVHAGGGLANKPYQSSAPTQLDMVLREEPHKSSPDGLIPSRPRPRKVKKRAHRRPR
jgi:hypothetical protein